MTQTNANMPIKKSTSTAKTHTMSTQNIAKPVLTAKGQEARLARFNKQLEARERELEQREADFEKRGNAFIVQLEQLEQQLKKHGEALAERELTVYEREQALIQLEQIPAKKPAPPKKRPKPTTSKTSLVIADLETSTSPAVPETKAPNLPETVSVPTPTPRPVSRPTHLFTHSSAKAETVFTPPPELSAPVFNGFFSIPTSPTPRATSFLDPFVLEPEPLKTLAIPSEPPLPIVVSPAKTPSSEKPKGKKKKKEISPIKQPGAWLKEHRRGLLTWFAATVGAATLTNYFAYLGREAVANKFAREANSLQTQSITINLDPNRLLRDKLFAEDLCRTGHAYLKIVKQYPTFVRQTPTRQLEVLALDPKIRKSINRIALGQKPVTTGICHLFR